MTPWIHCTNKEIMAMAAVACLVLKSITGETCFKNGPSISIKGAFEPSIVPIHGLGTWVEQEAAKWFELPVSVYIVWDDF